MQTLYNNLIGYFNEYSDHNLKVKSNALRIMIRLRLKVYANKSRRCHCLKTEKYVDVNCYYAVYNLVT